MKQKFLFFIIILTSTIIDASSAQYDNWGQSNGGNHATRNSTLKRINKDNIKNLAETWIYHSNDRALYDTVQTTPIYVNNLIITATITGKIIALNPTNGQEVWKTELPWHSARRGMSSFGEYIYITSPNETYELNSNNGKINKRFNAGSKVSPIIHK
jgi:outer membrane protein assembly factor BamB